MKRRTLLKAALLAPLAPLLSRLPAAAAPARVMIGWDPAAGPDFAGYWVGIEGAHGLELIQIEKFNQLYGQKVAAAVFGNGDEPE